MNSALDVHSFRFNTHLLAYRTLGNGSTALLAFHGFGQDSRAFESWQKFAGSTYTIYAIDLFFHGESTFATGNLLTKTDWQSLINAFLSTHHITNFSLAGFSLGGRFALITAEQFAHRLDQLILIAPDGITKIVWYQLATNTLPGRWLFGVMLRHLTTLNQMGHLLTRMGLLHRTIMRFAELSLATPVQRRQVYLSWTTFRPMKTDLPTLALLLNRLPIRVRFFTGYFDQIVPKNHIYPLTKKLHSYELTVLKAGHNRLIEQIASLL